LCWFYFYSGDLPNFAALTKFAPDSTATAFDECSSSPVQVISSASVGKNLENAVRAAEDENDASFALQISRRMFCNSRMTMLKRHLLEYKAAVQLRRRFTLEQVLTIYLNREHFGNNLIGAESASLPYYGKHASDDGRTDKRSDHLLARTSSQPSERAEESGHSDNAQERQNYGARGRSGGTERTSLIRSSCQLRLSRQFQMIMYFTQKGVKSCEP
jgi:hypothetical protein